MPHRAETGLKLTYEDFDEFPDDGRRHEILEGSHIVNPPPRPRHQILLGNLFDASIGLRRAKKATVIFSPIGVRLTAHDIVQPDLIAIASDRQHLIGELMIEGPPDLAVEILSPSTRRLDRGAKRALYESAGVREYWILDPEGESVTQHVLVEGRYSERLHTDGKVTSATFPELTVVLADVFRS